MDPSQNQIPYEVVHRSLAVEDVKEFISKLKEDFCTCIIDNINNKIGVLCKSCRKIDKLAGPALIHSQHPVAGDEADGVSQVSPIEKPQETPGTSDKGCANRECLCGHDDNCHDSNGCNVVDCPCDKFKSSNKLKGDGK